MGWWGARRVVGFGYPNRFAFGLLRHTANRRPNDFSVMGHHSYHDPRRGLRRDRGRKRDERGNGESAADRAQASGVSSYSVAHLMPHLTLPSVVLVNPCWAARGMPRYMKERGHRVEIARELSWSSLLRVIGRSSVEFITCVTEHRGSVPLNRGSPRAPRKVMNLSLGSNGPIMCRIRRIRRPGREGPENLITAWLDHSTRMAMASERRIRDA